MSAPGRQPEFEVLGPDHLFPGCILNTARFGEPFESLKRLKVMKTQTKMYTWKVEKKRWPGEARCCYFFGLAKKCKVLVVSEFRENEAKMELELNSFGTVLQGYLTSQSR